MYTENIMSPAHSVTQRLGLGCWLGHEFCVRTLSQRKGLIVFSGMFFFFRFFCFFHVFSPTVFAFASAGSALQALGAAERAGDEAPKPA